MLEVFVERQTRTLRVNHVLIFLRFLLAAVALAVLLIGEYQAVRTVSHISQLQPPPYLRPVGLIAIIVCALTILYLLILAGIQKSQVAGSRAQVPPGGRKDATVSRQSAQLAFVQVFVDLFLISALVWHTGGVDSQFVVLYLIAVCAAAFVLKWNACLLAAALATILFSLTALLYSAGYIPQSYALETTTAQLDKLRNLGPLDFLRLLLLPACAFFLTGALAGTLSRRALTARLLHDEILEGIGEGIAVLSPERKVLYHNREFARLLGLDHVPDTGHQTAGSGEPAAGARQPGPAPRNLDSGAPPGPPSLRSQASTLAGVSLKDLLGPAVDQQAQEALSEQTARRIEANHRLASAGRIVPFAIRLIPMLDPDAPDARGLIVALDDITAEKKMEEFLKHRQRIEAMGHISATIAHEIRNPLASIRGAVQEIGRSVAIPEDKKVLLEIVLSESDRLDQIISDFLRFARMRAPRLLPTDVGRVLADVKLLLSARQEAKDVQISLSGDEGEPFPADPEQLRQLFLNLGLNALQALTGRPRRELALRVSVLPRQHALGFPLERALDRPGVQVEVADTGPGMPPDVRSRVFEPFFTTKAAGTGLGLAIAERIVQGHEGLIAFDSQDGLGTTFRVWLPTNLAPAPAGVSGFRVQVLDGGTGQAGLPLAAPPARQPKRPSGEAT